MPHHPHIRTLSALSAAFPPSTSAGVQTKNQLVQYGRMREGWTCLLAASPPTVSRRLPGVGAMTCGSDSPCGAHSIAITSENVGESVQVGRQTTIVYWLFIPTERLSQTAIGEWNARCRTHGIIGACGSGIG